MTNFTNQPEEYKEHNLYFDDHLRYNVLRGIVGMRDMDSPDPTMEQECIIRVFDGSFKKLEISCGFRVDPDQLSVDFYGNGMGSKTTVPRWSLVNDINIIKSMIESSLKSYMDDYYKPEFAEKFFEIMEGNLNILSREVTKTSKNPIGDIALIAKIISNDRGIEI